MRLSSPMPEPTTNLWPHWKCRVCGADSREPDYAHSEFCLNDMPDCTHAGVVEWKRGKTAGERGNLPLSSAGPSYMRGWNFGRSLRQSERTVASLGQAADALRGRRAPHYPTQT